MGAEMDQKDPKMGKHDMFLIYCLKLQHHEGLKLPQTIFLIGNI